MKCSLYWLLIISKLQFFSFFCSCRSMELNFRSTILEITQKIRCLMSSSLICLYFRRCYLFDHKSIASALPDIYHVYFRYWSIELYQKHMTHTIFAKLGKFSNLFMCICNECVAVYRLVPLLINIKRSDIDSYSVDYRPVEIWKSTRKRWLSPFHLIYKIWTW